MQYEHLTQLCDLYGAHINRGVFTVAGRVGVHPKLFQRLKAGRGCTVSTFNHVLSWFDANWPADLEWPKGVARPSLAKRRAA